MDFYSLLKQQSTDLDRHHAPLRHIIPTLKTTRSIQTSCSTQIHYPNSKTTRSRQTSCSTQTHYPNSKTTRLCSFSLMLFLYPECSNTNVSLWFDKQTHTEGKHDYSIKSSGMKIKLCFQLKLITGSWYMTNSTTCSINQVVKITWCWIQLYCWSKTRALRENALIYNEALDKNNAYKCYFRHLYTIFLFGRNKTSKNL